MTHNNITAATQLERLMTLLIQETTRGETFSTAKQRELDDMKGQISVPELAAYHRLAYDLFHGFDDMGIPGEPEKTVNERERYKSVQK